MFHCFKYYILGVSQVRVFAHQRFKAYFTWDALEAIDLFELITVALLDVVDNVKLARQLVQFAFIEVELDWSFADEFADCDVLFHLGIQSLVQLAVNEFHVWD